MRRLKIYEQLLIVFIIAVLLPLCVATLIITNVNQHAVREELRYSASLAADNVYYRLLNNIEAKKIILSGLSKSLNYLDSSSKINDLLQETTKLSDDIINIELVTKDQISHNLDFTNSNIYIVPDTKDNVLILYAKLQNNKYLREYIDINKIKTRIFDIDHEKREIYVIDSNKNIVMSNNHNGGDFRQIISQLPKNNDPGEAVVFDKIKNQPNIFLKIKDPDWAIIVTTPKNLTSYGIIKARYKIIHSLVIAAISIIVIGVWYSLSLNTNIKQLLKAISALEKGNYGKRIRLIKRFFTPRELFFLANEFNNMAERIDNSYQELQSANKQLAKLDEMKSNLIDTVSHEFRTPLTSIRGYTSRLLRNDINVDDETRIKSLKVIKQQTERLSRLVEDLLVIPDIESSLIRLFPEEINLKDTFEACIMSVQQKQTRIINLSAEETLPSVYADPDRVEQVIINLLDNAIKYSHENSEINIIVSKENDKAIIKVQNECDSIPHERLNTLFGKFSRIDDNLTRTTRGTGLGLFIAKGLVENMGGSISLSGQNGFEVSFTLPIKTENSDESV